jgi:hypothetical protein
LKFTLCIILEDARLKLRDAPDDSYHLIDLDAFSSDTIPVHLMTREALALNLRKLTPGRHLLEPAQPDSLDMEKLSVIQLYKRQTLWS